MGHVVLIFINEEKINDKLVKKILKFAYFYCILFGKVFESSSVLMPGLIELKSFSCTIVIQILPINNHKKNLTLTKQFAENI